MEYSNKNIKEGIKLHTIKTDKFKTNLTAVFLTTKLERKTVTSNALISAILRRGSKNMPSQEEISKKLEELYGASFDCGVDKIGDNQVLKFYIESIDDSFAPNKNENILKNAIDNIFDIVFNPITEDEGFKTDFLNQEKDNIRQKIEGKIDNKARYALDRCIEEMYTDKAFSLYKFGYLHDLEQIDSKELYQEYKKLINECKIDIFVSGNITEDIESIIKENEQIQKLNGRKPKYNVDSEIADEGEKEVIERKDVSQGKLVVGLTVNTKNEEEKYIAMVYNNILGGSANSKIFQNVREKANLAYVASSSYLRYKDNIFINCGIEIENYQKALDLVKEQLNDIEKGKFTDEDIENAKKNIIDVINMIDDEQDTSITYCFGQEMMNKSESIQEYIEKIGKVSRKEIENIAKNVKINTIYFLRD